MILSINLAGECWARSPLVRETLAASLLEHWLAHIEPVEGTKGLAREPPNRSCHHRGSRRVKLYQSRPLTTAANRFSGFVAFMLEETEGLAMNTVLLQHRSVAAHQTLRPSD